MKLEKILTNATNFRTKFSGNLERIKKSDKYAEIILKPAKFDLLNSKIIRICENGEKLTNNYLDIAMWHPNYI